MNRIDIHQMDAVALAEIADKFFSERNYSDKNLPEQNNAEKDIFCSCNFDFDEIADISFGVFENGECIGFACIKRQIIDPSQEVGQYSLPLIFVNASQRFLGYGSSLVKYAEFLCLNRGAKILWTDKVGNAEGFFIKNGFSFESQEGQNKSFAKNITEHRCCGAHNND